MLRISPENIMFEDKRMPKRMRLFQADGEGGASGEGAGPSGGDGAGSGTDGWGSGVGEAPGSGDNIGGIDGFSGHESNTPGVSADTSEEGSYDSWGGGGKSGTGGGTVSGSFGAKGTGTGADFGSTDRANTLASAYKQDLALPMAIVSQIFGPLAGLAVRGAVNYGVDKMAADEANGLTTGPRGQAARDAVAADTNKSIADSTNLGFSPGILNTNTALVDTPTVATPTVDTPTVNPAQFNARAITSYKGKSYV